MAEKQGTMRQRFNRLRTDERGMSFIFVALSLMAFLAASMLAIDVGLFMTARTQAQRSADAGALAGATALVFNSFTDRSDTGPAVSSAVNTARANLVVNEAPSITPEDVNFPPNPETGRSDLVEVTVYRSSVRANPITTLMGRIFGVETANISATATAVAAPAGAANCVLPWTIPDKWIEQQTGPWTPDDTFDMYEAQGNNQNRGGPLTDPDIYIAPGHADATGYDPETDKGLQLVLKNNNQNKIAPSMYNAWDLPGSVGGDDYRDNIATCNQNLIEIGDTMTPENGNMTGPTHQGTDELVAQDPRARWDTTCKCVKDSAFRVSPRIRIVPLYHPVVYTQGQLTGKSQPQLEVVNYLGFFVEGVTGGGEVTGRITPITGKIIPGGPAAIGAFAQAIMLVR
jgi:Putative Flp pilus-assembly TadE/G-like